jgi:hypothetical protein
MARGKTAEKKKPARVAAGSEAPGCARSLGENVGRALHSFLPLAVMLAVVGGMSFFLWRSFVNGGVVHADSSNGTQAKDRLSAAMVRQAVLQTKRPAWISKEDFDQAAEAGVAVGQNRSVFEPGLSHALAAKYEECSWVERVRAVRLRHPAQMEIEIAWRQPVARVDRPSMVLDRNGVVLNLMADSAAVRDIPLISGTTPARTEVGQKVSEKELHEALGLLAVVCEVLRASPGQLKAASVQREASGTWRVITDRGPCIYWGFFTDDPPMDEPRTREKASLLHRRLCEMKDPSAFEYIKVYIAQAPVKPRGAAAGPPAGALSQAPGRARR